MQKQLILLAIMAFSWQLAFAQWTTNGSAIYPINTATDRVAIGTTVINPNIPTHDLTDYFLFVNGGILANEWLVPGITGWGDYVFEADYALKSLPEVEAYIEANGHLHDTPSAEMIEEQGLEVAAMTANQQVKIEELFLHVIELDKRLKKLAAENAQLAAENKQLKAKQQH
jgi:hypothetical protein